MWLTAAARQGDMRANVKLDALRSQLTSGQLMEASSRARSLARTGKLELQQALFH
jgi:hypothetical protein